MKKRPSSRRQIVHIVTLGQHAAGRIYAAPATGPVFKRAVAKWNFGGRGASPGPMHVAFTDLPRFERSLGRSIFGPRIHRRRL